jgi:hypothetical protein
MEKTLRMLCQNSQNTGRSSRPAVSSQRSAPNPNAAVAPNRMSPRQIPKLSQPHAHRAAATVNRSVRAVHRGRRGLKKP